GHLRDHVRFSFERDSAVAKRTVRPGYVLNEEVENRARGLKFGPPFSRRDHETCAAAIEEREVWGSREQETQAKCVAIELRRARYVVCYYGNLTYARSCEVWHSPSLVSDY